MTGSMIIEGRRVGKSVVIFIREEGTTINDVPSARMIERAGAGVPVDQNLYLDAHDALSTKKAQPTVYEGEVKFLSKWLKLAYEELNAAAH